MVTSLSIGDNYCILDTDILYETGVVLETLRRTRAGSIAEQRRRQGSSLKKELGNHFPRKRCGSKIEPAKKKKHVAWKHKFVCLAYHKQTRVPTAEAQKDELFEAGLGEKIVEFEDLEISAAEFANVIYHYFPKLKEGGGFSFFKCIPNSRNLEPLSKLAHSSPTMLKRRVGIARTYVRPLQNDLDVAPLNDLTDEVCKQI